MNENSVTPASKRNLWLRGLFMLLMFLAYHVCGTVLFIITVFQFVMVLLIGTPNARLVAFGRSMGSHLQQIAEFQTFSTEQMPFPFNNWPSGD